MAGAAPGQPARHPVVVNIPDKLFETHIRDGQIAPSSIDDEAKTLREVIDQELNNLNLNLIFISHEKFESPWIFLADSSGLTSSRFGRLF